MIPDIERIVSDYLRTHATITPLGARVVGKSPSSTDTAWVRVTQLDATSSHPSDHLIDALVQLDCYAGKDGGQPEATTLGRTVRAALMTMPGVQGGAVITGAQVVGHARIPDSDVDEPARERIVLTATIWAHA